MSMQNHQSQNRKSGLAKPLEPHAISVDEIAGFAEVLDQAPSFRQTLSAVAVTQNETSDVRFHDGSDGDAGLRVRVVASLLRGEIPFGRGHLEVEVHQSVVTLRGYLPTKIQQQRAIHLVLLISDVTKVVDYSQVGESPVREIVLAPTCGERMTSHRKTLATSVAMLLFLAVVVLRSSREDGIPVFPVTGEVRVEGRIPSGAFVVLHPVSRGESLESLPRGVVGSDGQFRIGTFTMVDGAPLGEYAVTVEWRPLVRQGEESVPGPNVIPSQYSKPETSQLRVRVAKGKNEVGPILLSVSSAS